MPWPDVTRRDLTFRDFFRYLTAVLRMVGHTVRPGTVDPEAAGESGIVLDDGTPDVGPETLLEYDDAVYLVSRAVRPHRD
jgi:hypothetical protein